jgi:hypothetical protein
MSDQLKIDEVHPSLRPLVQEFLLKCKYPYQIFGAGRWLGVEENGERVMYSQAVTFHDPNAENMVPAGTLKWQEGDFGRPYKFRVVTRKVLSPKYRDRERQRSVETLDPKRAMKEMLTHITPFTLSDIAAATLGEANSNIQRWRVEAQHSADHFFTNLANATIVQEVQHLLAKGVEFVTQEFQDIAREGIAAHHVSVRRKNTKMHKHFVKFEKNGTISVLSPHGQSTFTAFEMLPTFIQETIGMLKLMHGTGGLGKPDNASIPGVGTQINETTFWVFEPIEPNEKIV